MGKWYIWRIVLLHRNIVIVPPRSGIGQRLSVETIDGVIIIAVYKPFRFVNDFPSGQCWMTFYSDYHGLYGYKKNKYFIPKNIFLKFVITVRALSM